MSEPTGCLYCQGIERDKCQCCRAFEALGMLREVEWSAGGGDMYDYMPSGFCPFCDAPKWRSVARPEQRDTHFTGCRLAALLRLATSDPSGNERSFYCLEPKP